MPSPPTPSSVRNSSASGWPGILPAASTISSEGGWHRATIFRKVRRFRATYGAHPDEFVFPWIQLDLDTAWSEQISRQLEAARSRGFFG